MVAAAPADTGHRRPPLARRFGLEGAVQAAVIGVTVVLVAMPLLPILYQAILNKPLYDPAGSLTASNFARLIGDSQFHSAIRNSIVYAIGATIISQVLGASVAVLAARANIAGKVILTTLVMWPLFVSDLVLAMGWSFMYGPAGYVTQYAAALGIPRWNLNSMPGMIVVAGVSQAPLAYLYCIAAARALDPGLEDAARTSGATPAGVLWRIVLPLLWPAFLASTFFNLIIHLESLSIPLIFGEPARIVVLMTYIYARTIEAASQDYGLVAACSALLVVLVLVAVKVQRWMIGDTRRYVTIGGKGSRQKPFDLGPWRWPVSVVAIAVLAALVGVPLAGVLLQSFADFLSPLVPIADVLTLDHYREIFTQNVYLRAFRTSLLVSSIGAAIAVGLVFMIAVIVTRTQNRFGPALESVTNLTRAIPGMIAGLGFFYASVVLPPLGWLRGTIFILIIALLMRYLSLGYGVVMPNLIQVSAELERSARTAGATWVRSTFSILMPIMKPGLLAAYGILFLQFFKDYATTVYLFTTGNEVVPTLMLGLIRNGETGIIAALATVQLILTALFLFGLRRFARVRLYD